MFAPARLLSICARNAKKIKLKPNSSIFSSKGCEINITYFCKVGNIKLKIGGVIVRNENEKIKFWNYFDTFFRNLSRYNVESSQKSSFLAKTEVAEKTLIIISFTAIFRRMSSLFIPESFSEASVFVCLTSDSLLKLQTLKFSAYNLGKLWRSNFPIFKTRDES